MAIDVDNLLLNMSGGLPPENLTNDEIAALVKRYGSGWFERLGYSEPKYKRPHILCEFTGCALNGDGRCVSRNTIKCLEIPELYKR